MDPIEYGQLSGYMTYLSQRRWKIAVLYKNAKQKV